MNGVQLCVAVQPTPPLFGIRARLGQVLTNHLLNAATAIAGPREANKIRVSVRSVVDTRASSRPSAMSHARTSARKTPAGLAADS